MGRERVPVEREADNTFGKEGIVERHPAFGTVGIYRTTGQRHLFGSPLEKHDGYVTIRVNRAERSRTGVGYDFYHARKQVIEVALSEAQFAQLITSWNSGDGVPCTLDWIVGEGMIPDWPDEDHSSDTARVREEFKLRIEDVRKQVEAAAKELDSLLEKKGALTKDEKGRVRSAVTAMERLVCDTGPFMSEQFVEATEKTVQKAMTEIDAFVTKIALHTGLESLKKMEVSGLKAAGDQEGRLIDKHVDKVTSADPYLEGIMSRSERTLPSLEAICSKCYRKFSLMGRNPAYEGPTVCDECEESDLREHGVI